MSHKVKGDGSHSATDPENATDEVYRNAVYEPEDNDGENRNPDDDSRKSVPMTALVVAKTMIGSGVLNCPLVFKTLGIIPGCLFALLYDIFSMLSIYFLMKTKDITQRYSYSFFSKITMGLTGSVLMKLALIICTGTTCCVYFKIFGDLFKSLLLIFFEDKGQFYLQTNFLIIAIAAVLLPLMFKKDMSALSNLAALGIVALVILIISIILLFINKKQNDLIQPFSASMLYPSTSDPKSIFVCFAGFYTAFSFQFNAFPIYLPLTPRNSSNYVKATFLGGSLAAALYVSVGILGYIIYREKLDNSLLIYLKVDLVNYLTSNKFMATVLIICHVAYFFNTAISTILAYFSTKKNLFNFISLLRKGKKKEGQEGTQLEDLNKEKVEDDAKKADSGMGKFEFVLTIVGYVVIIIIALCTDKIIFLDNVNGATVGNYINIIAPSIFFLVVSKGKQYTCSKIGAVLFMGFGICLILGFFYINLFK